MLCIFRILSFRELFKSRVVSPTVSSQFSAMQYHVFHETWLQRRFTDDTGRQSFDEEREKQERWNCSAFQQELV